MSLRECPWCRSADADYDAEHIAFECQTCLAFGPFAGSEIRDHEEGRAAALIAWNTRTPDPRVAELEGEVERLRGIVKDAIDWMDRSDMSSGVCCCGEDMAGHSFASGHSPTDTGEYYSGLFIERARAALQSPTEKEAGHEE